MGDLVTDLQGLGYELTLDRGNLHFRYAGTGDPPERAATLLEEVKQHKTDVLDYLRLLQTPQADLGKPLFIESGILNDRVFLVAIEEQAQEIEKAGIVVYLPGEVRVLLMKSAGMDEGTVKGYLTKVHVIKRVFSGARVMADKPMGAERGLENTSG